MHNRIYQLLLMFLLCSQTSMVTAQTDSVITELIFIGDAGELHHQQHPVLAALQKKWAQLPKATALFYLGDNLYPSGLTESGNPGYNNQAAILDTQWKAGLALANQVFFIPGNHDWAKGRPYGAEQIKRQQLYITDMENPRLHFLPQDACPGPETIQLTDQLTIVIMDSQWWLQRENRPGITSDCDCKTEEEVVLRLQEIMYKNRDKTVLFLTHHPFASDGIHGGYYTAKQHLFPLTDWNPALYIPLPLIGSIYPLARGGFGNIQDIKHPIYRKMIQSIEEVLNQHPACIRIAGHEHGLQHIIKNNQHYIVSGAGAKFTRHRKSGKGHESFSTTGYTKLQLLSNDSIRIVFMEATENEHRELYTTTINGVSTNTMKEMTRSTSAAGWPDSVSVAAAPYFKAGKTKQWWFGTNYRKDWTSSITVPTLLINTDAGGLTPTKRGGGMQSRSLRLEDSTGKEYVIRSIEKYPDKTLPEELRQTFVKDAIVDGISASYPYAALSIPALAKAAGIPHLEPKLIYLPDDPALGQYRKDFGKQLYLWEAREPEGLKKTYSTDKVIEALEKDNDNLVDQQAVLKARLLDMFIMDFDRHDDQWRWGSESKKEGKLYFPIPRDRDQAFFTSTGVIPWLISRSWLIPKFQGFRAKAQDINTFNFNARYFDRSFLNKTNRADWEKATTELLAALSDSIIDEAMLAQPAPINSGSALQIANTLKNRKQYLMKEALSYQAFLHKTLDIPGSDKKDWFELQATENGQLQLNIYDINKEGDSGDKVSEQFIDPAITKELRLYGLKGADVFRISGNMPKHFRLRIIGGGGNDSLIANQLGNRKAAIKWYDRSTENNSLSGTGAVQLKFADKPGINKYDRKSFRYNITAPLVLAAFNQDDGIILGAGIKSTRHAFRKEPYAYQHQFTAYYAVATGAYQFRYRFDASWLRFMANIKAPNNTRNFFGLGNETVFDKSSDKKITYYRSRFNLFELAALAKWNAAPVLQLLAGPVLQHYWIDYDDNEGRFITDPSSGLDQTRLQQKKTYLGLQAHIILDTRNNHILPTRGIHWVSTAGVINGHSKNARSFQHLETSLSYFWGLGGSNKVVLAGRIGGGSNYGNYEFFQAQTLGGNESLRGYRNFRFSGDQRFFNNLDLRIKLTEIRGYLLPGTLGLLLFQDIGRVWLQQEKSNKWHLGYGGGIWIAPANRIVIAACYGQSDEGGLPFISLGYQF